MHMAVRVPNTAVFTARVHGVVRTVYMAVYTTVYVVYGRVHRRARAVYMVRPRPYTGYTYTVVYPVHGRVYGACTLPPTDCVHGRARATYIVRP